MNEPIDASITDRADLETSVGQDGSGRPGRPEDPSERPAGAETIDAEKLADSLCSDQVDRWRAGERIPVEAYLARHPTLSGGHEAAFELIYGEYLLRESLGESPRLEEFCWRFPEYAERFRRQIDSTTRSAGPRLSPRGKPGAMPGRIEPKDRLSR
jgi:hypothetical protein